MHNRELINKIQKSDEGLNTFRNRIVHKNNFGTIGRLFETRLDNYQTFPIGKAQTNNFKIVEGQPRDSILKRIKNYKIKRRETILVSTKTKFIIFSYKGGMIRPICAQVPRG